LIVTLGVCAFCSVLVAGAAVLLRQPQEANKLLDRKRNILMAAGLLAGDKSVDELFADIDARVVDLATGEYAAGTDPETYDQRQAARDPAQSVEIPLEKDLAGNKRRARLAPVYLVRGSAEVVKIILPVHGKGLWSTLYGFLALDAGDLSTIRALIFYEHAETPGLGGEVDNPNWRALWNGKQAFDEQGSIRIEVAKGKVDPGRPEARYQVDGISGASITTRGVGNLLKYWLGEDGFGPYLSKLKEQGVIHGEIVGEGSPAQPHLQ
jgi:Na+-transporting NADH:ubiquinone oxidoreductase subunit C